jgi:hypothetical protein
VDFQDERTYKFCQQVEMAKESNHKTLDDFLQGKSQHTLELFRHFTEQFQKLGDVQILPAKQ